MRRVETATLTATVLGSGLIFIDMASVNVFLPILQQEFDTGLRAVQWVVESFILFLAALILLAGALGDRWGRRRIFRAGLVVFGLASLASAAAPTVWALVAARAMQGIGAALMMPASIALIADNIPPERRATAYGTWVAVSGLTFAGGPVLAGWLADTWTWRILFLLNVPFALVVLVALGRVPESARTAAKRLDVPGAVLATVALGGVTFGLVESNVLGLAHPLVVSTVLVGVAAAVAFLVVERRRREPMVPLGLFRIRPFAGMNAATLLVYAALGGALFFVPFNLIQVQGWSATAAGAALLPSSLMIGFLSSPLGKLTDRVGARVPVTLGCLLAAEGYLLLARPGLDADYWSDFFPGFVLLGLGMATLVPGLTATVMGSVPPERTGVASGVNNAIARTAGLLSVALFGLIAVQVFAGNLPPDVRDALGPDVNRLAEASPPPGATSAAIDAAFVHAYRLLMVLGSLLCVVAAPIAWMTIPPRQRQQVPDASSGPATL